MSYYLKGPESIRAYGVAALGGVVTHIYYFNRGEHHLYPARYLLALIAAVVTAVAFLVFVEEKATEEAIFQVLPWVGSYLAGLYTSLFTYRLLLSPLNRFPGPLGARVSSFWLSTRLGKLDLYRQIHELHKQYGPVVRIGPSALSISKPQAVPAIYGANSKCRKGDWYSMSLPTTSLHSMRDRPSHDKRRRVWSPAFSDKALRGYEQRIWVHRQRFFEKIHSAAAAQKGAANVNANGNEGSERVTINVTRWFNWYSFDVMGDLAFGRPFDMVENSADHWAIKLVDDNGRIFGFLFPAWFLRFLAGIPGATRAMERFIDYCTGLLKERMKVGFFCSLPFTWFY